MKHVFRFGFSVLAAWCTAMATAQDVTAPKQLSDAELVQVIEKIPASSLVITGMIRMPAAFNDVNRVQWSLDGQRLLFDRERRYVYEVVEAEIPAKPTAESVRFIKDRVVSSIAKRGGVPVHQGSACYYPLNAKVLVYAIQSGKGGDAETSSPDNGIGCNLFVGNTVNRDVQQLTYNVSSFKNPTGATGPVFSPDGKQLFWCGAAGTKTSNSLWADRKMFGAEFVIRNGMVILVKPAPLTDFPGKDFCECYKVSSDGKTLLLSANMGKPGMWFGSDLCLMDLQTRKVTNLTKSPAFFDRYGDFSAQGNKIIWSASDRPPEGSMGRGNFRWKREITSELWVMEKSGKDQSRLTHFNDRESQDREFLGVKAGNHCYVGSVAWRPNTNQVAMVIHFGGYRDTSCVVIAEIGLRHGALASLQASEQSEK